MRKRVGKLGRAWSEITSVGNHDIKVALSGDRSTVMRREREVGKTALLLFYDWEPNIIGSHGTPAPSESTVTGGPEAGSSQYGLPEYQAVLRAAKRATIARREDTTWEHGCTPQQVGGCMYGSWYLLDMHHEVVLRGPVDNKEQLYSDHLVPTGAQLKAVRVNPGTVLIEARPVENARGAVTQVSPNSWYALNDDPVLTGSEITDPQQGVDEGAGGAGAPNVTFGFTPHGKKVFEELTKKIAIRGREAQLPGVGKEAAQQHFAVVLDGQLIANPSIDYTEYPEGIDASTGSEIAGGFTITSARELAQELQSGALPIQLELISHSYEPGR